MCSVAQQKSPPRSAKTRSTRRRPSGRSGTIIKIERFRLRVVPLGTRSRGPAGGSHPIMRRRSPAAARSNAGISAHETLRRLNHAIVEYQNDRLVDDATIVLVEWMPDRPERLLISLG